MGAGGTVRHPQASNLNAATLVPQFEFDVKYSVVNQKVQSSAGSIAIPE